MSFIKTFHSILVLQNSDDDVSQFDTKFTRQIPIDSPDDSTLSESCNMIFQVRRERKEIKKRIKLINVNYFSL